MTDKQRPNTNKNAARSRERAKDESSRKLIAISGFVKHLLDLEEELQVKFISGIGKGDWAEHHSEFEKGLLVELVSSLEEERLAETFSNLDAGLWTEYFSNLEERLAEHLSDLEDRLAGHLSGPEKDRLTEHLSGPEKESSEFANYLSFIGKESLELVERLSFIEKKFSNLKVPIAVPTRDVLQAQEEFLKSVLSIPDLPKHPLQSGERSSRSESVSRGSDKSLPHFRGGLVRYVEGGLVLTKVFLQVQDLLIKYMTPILALTKDRTDEDAMIIREVLNVVDTLKPARPQEGDDSKAKK